MNYYESYCYCLWFWIVLVLFPSDPPDLPCFHTVCIGRRLEAIWTVSTFPLLVLEIRIRLPPITVSVSVLGGCSQASNSDNNEESDGTRRELLDLSRPCLCWSPHTSRSGIDSQRLRSERDLRRSSKSFFVTMSDMIHYCTGEGQFAAKNLNTTLM